MIEVSWPVFVIASLVLIATPGQDMILVMSRSIAQGPAAGVATAAGVSVGLIGHTSWPARLGAILRTSSGCSSAQFVGAISLISDRLAAVEARLADPGPSGNARVAAVRRRRTLERHQSKIAIFLFAFLPQFRRPNATHPRFRYSSGLVFAALTFAVKAPWAVAGALSGRLRARRRLRWLFRPAARSCGPGVRLAFERRR